MKWNILALDAAFGPACACLLRQDDKQFHAVSSSEKPHSQTLLPMLNMMLNEADMAWSALQLFAIGIGPGSFTGLRVAAATMNGLNAGLRLPMLEISSLAITALQCRKDGPVWVIEDARTGSAWLGIYKEGDPLQDDRIRTQDEILGMPAATCISHSGPAITLDGWKRLPLERSRCEALAILADRHANQCHHPDKLPRFATPAYLCPSQAEGQAWRV